MRDRELAFAECDVAFPVHDVAFADHDVVLPDLELGSRDLDVVFAVHDVVLRDHDVAFRGSELALRLSDVVLLLSGAAMSQPEHCVLIAEDDIPTAQTLGRYVRALGMRAVLASTLVEIDRAIEAGGFCCVLLDKELPAADGDPPLIATGDTAQRRLRAVDPRRNADDHHLLPILILTKVPPTPALLNAQYRQGASGFLAKPATPEVIASEVLGALERAGRRDHAQCAKLAAGAARPAAEEEPPADPHAAKRVHVRLDRRRIGRRTTFLVDGRRADLQDNLFVPFFKLAVVRARGSDAYRSTSDLGIFRTPHAPSRIRAALEMVMPKGMSILQRGEEGMFRLHPLVVVEPIDWAVFEKHPHAGVQAVAAAERKLR